MYDRHPLHLLPQLRRHLEVGVRDKREGGVLRLQAGAQREGHQHAGACHLAALVGKAVRRLVLQHQPLALLAQALAKVVRQGAGRCQVPPGGAACHLKQLHAGARHGGCHPVQPRQHLKTQQGELACSGPPQRRGSGNPARAM